MNLAIIGINNRDFIYKMFSRNTYESINPVLFLEYDRQYKEILGEDGLCTNFEALRKLYNNGIDAVYLNLTPHRKLSWITKKLLDSGIDNIYLPYPIALRDTLQDTYELFTGNGFNKRSVYKVRTDKPFIGHLEIHIVDRCNLNCKGCTHYAPISNKQTVSLDGIKQDIRRLSELFDNIIECWLLGGEPLLEPDLLRDVITEFRKYFPKTDLSITTNGLLIPELKQDDIDIIKSNNVTMMISDYTATNQMREQIKARFESEGISYTIGKPRQDFHVMKIETPSFKPDRMNDRCVISEIAYLKNGKLSKCPESLLVKKMDEAFGTSVYCADEIDIYKEKNAWDIFTKLINPIASCAYCNYPSREYRPWEPFGSELPRKEYWLTDNKLGRNSGYEEKISIHTDATQIVELFLAYQMQVLYEYYTFRADARDMIYILCGNLKAARGYCDLLEKYSQKVMVCDFELGKFDNASEGVRTISYANIKEVYDPQTHKIIAVSDDLVNISKQLANNQIITSIDDIMPPDGALNDLFASTLKSIFNR